MSTGQYVVKQVKWDSPEAGAARQIRMDVFVHEQNVPAELELDELDPSAYHVVAYTSMDEPCGTGRLFAEPDDPATAHIGRMAVLNDRRGSGCGAAILTQLIRYAEAQKFRRMILSAQTHAVPFYAKHGFSCYGEEYLDAGIPHRMMELALN